jgi:hypothetical protein
MIRVSIRIAAITYGFVVGLWGTREAYAPGRQYNFPWLTSIIAAIIAGVAAAIWYRRHPPRAGYGSITAAAITWYQNRRRSRRQLRRGDPGE